MSITATGQASAELPHHGVRMVDTLLDAMPQEAAASVTLVQKIGDTVFLACREFSDEEANPVTKLTSPQYKVLLLASAALDRQSIADELGVAWPTVRTHLYSIYNALGVRTKSQAASFIPMDEQALWSVPSLESLLTEEGDGSQSVLSRREAPIFTLIADDHTSVEIARIRGKGESTIRSQRLAIAKKLGIEASNGVPVRRIAGAIRTLRTEVTTTLQPQITETLARLAEGADVAPDTPEHGQLDLPGLIEALLIDKPESQAIMGDRLRQPIARQVIRHAVDVYMENAGREPTVASGR